MEDFFFEPASAEESSLKETSSSKEKISFVNIPYQNGAVVLMNHPASLTLYKHLTVLVLSGCVSINGYEIKKGNTVQVFSSEKTGLIEMKTERYESIWKKKARNKNLANNLHKLFKSEDICHRILQKFGNLTVGVFIKRCFLPSNLEFAEFYYPHAFEFSLYEQMKSKDFLWLDNDVHISTLKFGEEEENLASEIAILIRNAKLTDSEPPRIIVCGPRNTGKSVFLKYLLNKILTEGFDSYYLDTDPGQPEFTPPGIVSLTKVDKPVIGPPFYHLKKKSLMIFTGDVSPSLFELYNKSISTLMMTYKLEYSDHPLFVNTMGWVEGTGLQCLKNTIGTVKPTVLVEIIPKGGTSMFDYRDYLPPDSQYFQICCKHDHDLKCGLSSKMMRELSLLSHLGYNQPPYLSAMPINEFRPYCVSWNKIPIFVFPGGNVFPARMIEVLNGSIVALCQVSEDCILESENPVYPKTLEPDPENEFLAYGLVQAVDEENELLYIITHLKKDILAKVNAIIKGNIMVPDPLILKQEIYDEPLPFTNVIEQSSNDEEMDVSMISLKYVSDAESPEPKSHEPKSFPPIENLRKPIRKRHHQKKIVH